MRAIARILCRPISRLTEFPRQRTALDGWLRNGYTCVYPLWYGSRMALKDCGMRIRVEKELRDAFVQACRAQDRVAADVLRDFMHSFTDKQHRDQADLFARTEGKK